MRWITAGSSIVASTTMRPPHCGQESTSAWNARRMSSARARYLGRARPGCGSSDPSGSDGGEGAHASGAVALSSALRATTARRHGAFGARTP